MPVVRTIRVREDRVRFSAARQAKRRRDARLRSEGDEMPEPLGAVPDKQNKV
jgi:hypothetical protein